MSCKEPVRVGDIAVPDPHALLLFETPPSGSSSVPPLVRHLSPEEDLVLVLTVGGGAARSSVRVLTSRGEVGWVNGQGLRRAV